MNLNCKLILCSALAATLVAGCASEGDEHHDHSAKEAKLMSEAKITKEDAQQIAMTKVPNGTIKEAELEREHGKLIWSFDVTTPDSKDVLEVNVDAINGDVISVGKDD